MDETPMTDREYIALLEERVRKIEQWLEMDAMRHRNERPRPDRPEPYRREPPTMPYPHGPFPRRPNDSPRSTREFYGGITGAR